MEDLRVNVDHRNCEVKSRANFFAYFLRIKSEAHHDSEACKLIKKSSFKNNILYLFIYLFVILKWSE